MAITLVASVSAAPGANGGTSAAIDTTGATLIVVASSYYGGGTASVITDAKSNVYTTVNTYSGSLTSIRLFYKLSPAVGTGHTFTVTASGAAPTLFVYAFAGVASYQTESGAGSGGSVASLACGSVTPAANGALVYTGTGGIAATVDTIAPAGFSTPVTKTFVSGTNMQGSAAYYIQPTAAGINPTWSYSPSVGSVAVGCAVFLASVGAAVETAQAYVWGPL